MACPENLYTNAVKYAMEHSRVYVDVLDEDGKAIFTIKNVSGIITEYQSG